ncbi:transmembrane protein 45B-like [Anneissia japonica]|uniref:transmembrane protein 45B-like n=1 Tax=Anneissia japonica TaxID=1529436 RepID=UPI0014254C34|nr:transmembrane protein 45B-like [Anneissia japonica]
MGSWLGHTAPGTFFITGAIWWMIQLSYHKYRDNHQAQCRLIRYLSQKPVEGISIVVVALVGVFGENMHPAPKWRLFDAVTGDFVHMNVWQHCTMYVYFGLYGMIKIIGQAYVPKLLKYSTVFLSLAFGIEGLLFYYHVHGHDDLDIHIHMLLVLAAFGCCILAFLEFRFPDEPIYRLTRILFTMVQGTWFWMIGTVLYQPPSGKKWSPDDHENLMFLTTAFTWHVLVSMGVLTIIYHIVRKCMICMGHQQKSGMPIQYQELANSSNQRGVEHIGLLETAELGSDLE